MSTEFKINKFAFKKVKINAEPSSKEYWLTQSVEARIDAVEFLRSQYHTKDELKRRLQRVYTITKF